MVGVGRGLLVYGACARASLVEGYCSKGSGIPGSIIRQSQQLEGRSRTGSKRKC